jgi:hypothetical protein
MLWVPFRAKGLLAGLMHRPLRRLDDGSLRSAVFRIPAGWSSGGNTRLAERIQMYALSGAVRVGDRVLKASSYLCNHPGRIMPQWGSVEEGPTGEEAQVLLICDGSPTFRATGYDADDICHRL